MKLVKKPLYIGYLTAGQISLDHTLKAAQALVAGGVNCLEIGVPYSDPIADGPVIAEAMQQALSHGITLKEVLRLCAEIKSQVAVPVILFTYLNPLLAYLQSMPVCRARPTLDGMLLVDASRQQPASVKSFCQQFALPLIPIVAPNSITQRLSHLLSNAPFIYLLSRKGVTGSTSEVHGEQQHVQEIRRMTHAPIVAGFGINQSWQVKKLLQQLDGFVVGTHFIKAIAEGCSMQQLTRCARQLLEDTENEKQIGF